MLIYGISTIFNIKLRHIKEIQIWEYQEQRFMKQTRTF